MNMMCPEGADEMALAQRMLGREEPEAKLSSGAVRPVLSIAEFIRLREGLEELVVREELVGYIVDVIRRTRTHEAVLVGGGPRATQALLLAARAYAAIAGRDFATPDDVKAMARPVLEHRLGLRPEFEIAGLASGEVIERILQDVAVPR